MSDLTVIIPVWNNYQRFLERALASIREQKNDCEVLIYDNGSETPICLSEVDTGELRVRVLRSETTCDLGKARNKALDEVNTDFVCFHDVDDLLLPGALSFAMAEHHRRFLASVALQSLCTDGHGHYWRIPSPFWQPLAHHIRAALIWRTLESNLLAFGGGCVLRSACVRAAGGFADLSYGEEMPLNIALAIRWPCRWYRRFGRLYVVREGSLWHRELSHEEIIVMHETRLRRLDDYNSIQATVWRARLRQRAQRQLEDGVSNTAAPGKEIIVSLKLRTWIDELLQHADTS